MWFKYIKRKSSGSYNRDLNILKGKVEGHEIIRGYAPVISISILYAPSKYYEWSNVNGQWSCKSNQIKSNQILRCKM